MIKLGLIILAAIILSMFYFPFNPVFTGGINTKLMLAAVSLLLVGWNALGTKTLPIVPKELFMASLLAILFSFICWCSVNYNNTDDFTYATYFVSMWVWYGAAYVVCYVIAQIHGYISFRLIANYLISISVIQCVLALVINFVPVVKSFVDTYFDVTSNKFVNEVERLYGIGASLDTAGTRFACVLVIIAVILSCDKLKGKYISLYIVSFLIITSIGSMISRTTSVGATVALIYMLLMSGVFKVLIKQRFLKLWGIFLLLALLLVLVANFLYMNNTNVHDLLRYGFEGFFNWIEKGKWETSSTNQLKNLWIFPTSWKTWLIGDGYFMDPNVQGRFYMGTDVGFLRFIFYCGTIGLLLFSCLFAYLTRVCYRMYPKEKHVFFLLFILVFIIWIKVSSDIFLVYALYVCVAVSPKYLVNKQISRYK